MTGWKRYPVAAAIYGLAIYGLALADAHAASDGVRHQVLASLAPAPDFKQTGSGFADLTLLLFVSSHSVQSNIGRKMPVRFDHVAWPGSSGEREVWHDDKCHQLRGYPKLTALAVDGVLPDDDKGRGGVRSINARPRAIGMLLPRDELVISQAARRQHFVDHDELVWRVSTTSRISFELRVKSFPCLF